MYAASYDTKDERQRALDEVKQHIAGKSLPRPFPDAEDKDLSGYEVEGQTQPESIAERSQQRFLEARLRDARRAMASGPYLRAKALGGALREIYDGGRKNLEGGIQ